MECGYGRGARQREPKDAAFAQHTLNANSPTLTLDIVLDDSESDTAALFGCVPPSLISPVKAGKEVRQLGRSDPLTRVPYLEQNYVSLRARRYGHYAATGGVFEGVVQQVGKRLQGALGVGLNV